VLRLVRYGLTFTGTARMTEFGCPRKRSKDNTRALAAVPENNAGGGGGARPREGEGQQRRIGVEGFASE